MEKKQFTWVNFYKAFAERLLDFRNDRETLISKIKEAYELNGVKFPKLESDGTIDDLDPFTVFSFFNKGYTDENRLKIIKSFSDVFQIEADLPEDFRGIPVVNFQNANYFAFREDRKGDEFENLWGLFEAALDYSKDDSLVNQKEVERYFELVINSMGVGNAKITMGLFWIAPESFVSLDKVNRDIIFKSQQLDKEFIESLPKIEPIIKSSTYFEILNKLKNYINSQNSGYDGFTDFSYKAWNYSQVKDPVILPGVSDSLVHHWIYSPGDGASMWDEFYKEKIMAVGWDYLGDLKQYDSKLAIRDKMQELRDSDLSYMHDAHATWQFANEMEIGDIVFVKKGRTTIVGRGIVTSDYIFDKSRKDKYKHTRKVDWTHSGEWDLTKSLPLKTLTDCSDDVETIKTMNILLEIEDSEKELVKVKQDKSTYTRDDFLHQVYMEAEKYDDLVALLKRKKNVILEGPPGVGKTFMAKRLAFSMMGEIDSERVSMVQFHQSYSYEDFIEGYRPMDTGFEIKRGAFYDFCDKARLDDERPYFFIIDEINRGNLSKIFGELFMLIEGDKRGSKLNLLYSNEKFSVPENVHIIGMMNTADRSLAMLDYALRRRFAFYELKPGFDTEGFKNYQNSLENDYFNKLVTQIKELNQAIAADASLGQSFSIGHSYLCDLKEEELDSDLLRAIVDYELIPLIKEYWFDELDKVRDWSDRLRGALR